MAAVGRLSAFNSTLPSNPTEDQIAIKRILESDMLTALSRLKEEG